MALHYGDRLTTGPDTSANLRIGDPLEDFTLYPGSQVELIDPHTLRFKLGKLFEQAHDYFLVTTDWVNLGVRGTAFQVEATSGEIKVAQLDDELAVAPSGGAATTMLQPLPACDQKLVAPCRLNKLTILTMTKRDAALQAHPIGLEECEAIVNTYANVVIAAKPQFPSESLIPNFQSPEARAQSFREARFGSFWRPESTAYFETLGDVYVDWGEGEMALSAYRRAGEAQRQGKDLAIFYDKLGNALRLAGQFDSAENYYEKALSLAPTFAFPFNGLGDVYRDRALVEVRQGHPANAVPLLARADDFYKNSLDRGFWGKEGGRNRAIPLTNLGDLELLKLYVVSLTKTQDLTAEQRLAVVQKADEFFQQSLKEYPDYPYALTGQANAYMAKAQIYAAAGQADKGKEAFDIASLTLKHLIATYPTFAPAYVSLAELCWRQGNVPGSLEQFEFALRLDPNVKVYADQRVSAYKKPH
jgi:tetratricopeptide (TPR) repeat protein